jgi:hypothetical protein
MGIIGGPHTLGETDTLFSMGGDEETRRRRQPARREKADDDSYL